MTNATLNGKPYAGNPHVRFEVGGSRIGKPRRGSLLYKLPEIKKLALLAFSAFMLTTNAATETVNVPADGGAVKSTSVSNTSGSNWTFDDGDSPAWITDISVGYITLKSNGRQGVRNWSMGSTGPWQFTFKVAANTGAAREWTMVVKDSTTKATVWSVKVSQTAGTVPGPTPAADFGFPPAAQLLSNVGWSSAVCIYDATTPPQSQADVYAYNPLSTFEKGSDVCYKFLYVNYGTAGISFVKHKAEILTDDYGIQVAVSSAEDVSGTLQPGKSFCSYDWEWSKLSNLPAGKYRLKITLDPDESVSESDRSDNTAVFKFTVTEPQTSGGTAPAAPTNVSTETLSASSIRITWTAASGATSYKVYRAPQGHMELSDFVCIASGITGVSYNDTGLAADTMYYYRVSACNSAGETMCQYMSPCSTSQGSSPSPTPTPFIGPVSETVNVPADGGAVKSTSVSNTSGSNWTFDDGDSPAWITDISVGYITLKSNGRQGVRNWSMGSTGPWQFTFTVAANTGAAREWTMVVKDSTTKATVWSVKVSQAAGSAGGNTEGSSVGGKVTVVEKLFGVGQASEFMVGANEKAFVVGVSGLTWCDFAPRAYKGQGWQDADKAGQSFHCFDDSRIMDVEKMSALDSIDHDWCYQYADMQALLWGGYISGFSDVDALADYLRSAGTPDAYMEFVPVFPTDYVCPNIVEADKFVGELVSAFSGCNARGTMDVWVDHQSGEREAACHSVSVVGYSLDTTKALSDPAALRGLFVIDSDNDMYDGQGGSAAPNSITYCPVSYEAYGGSALMGLSAGNRFVIRNVFGTWGLVDSVLVVRAKTAASVNKTVNLEWPISCSDSGMEDMKVNVPVVTPSGAFEAAKARTDTGVLIQDGIAAGVLQVKVGKASSKGESKVSVTVIGLDGKKYTAKAVKIQTGATQTATFEVKTLGRLELTFGANGFSGTLNGATVTSVDAVAATTPGKATFGEADLSSLSGVQTDYLPKDETVTRTEKKWTVAKAGKLKYVKPKPAKGIAGGLVATGTNIAGLKLTYAAKTQTFKGSFKIWTLDPVKNKLKAVAAKVTGVVVNGTGYGEVTVKKTKIGKLTVK